jgi:hypothetical protein
MIIQVKHYQLAIFARYMRDLIDGIELPFTSTSLIAVGTRTIGASPTSQLRKASGLLYSIEVRVVLWLGVQNAKPRKYKLYSVSEYERIQLFRWLL